MITRRNFLTSLIAAPAIVRCSSLMSLRGVPIVLDAPFDFSRFYFGYPLDPMDEAYAVIKRRMDELLYGDK